MSDSILVADVGLDSRTAGAEAIYTYRARPDLAVGEAVFIPLGPRRAIGFVLDVRCVSPEELGFPMSALKDIGTTIRGLDLPGPTVDLVREVSRQTLTSISTCLGLAVPPGIKDRLVTSWSRVDGGPEEKLSPTQDETMRVLLEGPILDSKGKALPDGAKRTLRSLEKRVAELRRILS